MTQDEVAQIYRTMNAMKERMDSQDRRIRELEDQVEELESRNMIVDREREEREAAEYWARRLAA